MLAASNDTIVSTAAIEEFAYHLRAGSHLVIAGSKHEILQEQDRYRAQFWAAFDAFVPGTPLFNGYPSEPGHWSELRLCYVRHDIVSDDISLHHFVRA